MVRPNNNHLSNLRAVVIGFFLEKFWMESKRHILPPTFSALFEYLHRRLSDRVPMSVSEFLVHREMIQDIMIGIKSYKNKTFPKDFVNVFLTELDSLSYVLAETAEARTLAAPNTYGPHVLVIEAIMINLTKSSQGIQTSFHLDTYMSRMLLETGTFIKMLLSGACTLDATLKNMLTWIESEQSYLKSVMMAEYSDMICLQAHLSTAYLQLEAWQQHLGLRPE